MFCAISIFGKVVTLLCLVLDQKIKNVFLSVHLITCFLIKRKEKMFLVFLVIVASHLSLSSSAKKINTMCQAVVLMRLLDAKRAQLLSLV